MPDRPPPSTLPGDLDRMHVPNPYRSLGPNAKTHLLAEEAHKEVAARLADPEARRRWEGLGEEGYARVNETQYDGFDAAWDAFGCVPVGSAGD